MPESFPISPPAPPATAAAGKVRDAVQPAVGVRRGPQPFGEVLFRRSEEKGRLQAAGLRDRPQHSGKMPAASVCAGCRHPGAAGSGDSAGRSCGVAAIERPRRWAGGQPHRRPNRAGHQLVIEMLQNMGFVAVQRWPTASPGCRAVAGQAAPQVVGQLPAGAENKRLVAGSQQPPKAGMCRRTEEGAENGRFQRQGRIDHPQAGRQGGDMALAQERHRRNRRCSSRRAGKVATTSPRAPGCRISRLSAATAGAFWSDTVPRSVAGGVVGAGDEEIVGHDGLGFLHGASENHIPDHPVAEGAHDQQGVMGHLVEVFLETRPP